MSEVTVWFNPECSKCRGLQDLLSERGTDVEYRNYLEQQPTKAEAEALLEALGGDAQQLLRSKEAVYQEMGLGEADDDALLDALVAHPHLLNRPILVRGLRAVIARPPEAGLSLLD